jgi:hypothetical protein
MGRALHGGSQGGIVEAALTVDQGFGLGRVLRRSKNKLMDQVAHITSSIGIALIILQKYRILALDHPANGGRCRIVATIRAQARVLHLIYGFLCKIKLRCEKSC